MMDPSSDEVICDPACGTSGFLVAAGEYLKENKKEEIFFDKQKKEHYMNHMFHGYDMDRTMLRIGAMNMMTHGLIIRLLSTETVYQIRIRIKINIRWYWQIRRLKEVWMRSQCLEIC